MTRTTLTFSLVTSLAIAACSANDGPSGFAPDVSPTGGSGGEVIAPAAGGVPSSSGGSGGVVQGTGGTPVASGGSTTIPTDPSAFAWPESSPDGGSAGLCKPGHYTGTYKCTVTGPMGAPAVGFELTGPVDLQLAQAQEGEFLVVSGGKLKTSAGALQLDSGLVGKLDCQTGKFTGALDNGQLSIPPFPPGGTVEGTLEGHFVPATTSMDGSWSFSGGTSFPGYGCDGPWTITWDGA